MKSLLGGAVLASIVQAAAAAADCDGLMDGAVVSTTNPKVLVRTDGGTFPLGQVFAIEIVVCDDDGAWQVLGVDATMPAHGHGMNYRPVLKPHRGGASADGLLFHMPGTWELSIKLRNAQGARIVRAPVDVSP